MELLVLFLISLVANTFSAFSGGGTGLAQLPALIVLGLPWGRTRDPQGRCRRPGARCDLAKPPPSQLRPALRPLRLACGIPGVVLGAGLILRVPDRTAQIALGLHALGLGPYSLANRQPGQSREPRHRYRRGMLVGGIAILIIGALNGSLTSGTGLMLTLWRIRWFGLDYRRAVAHTLALVGVFWNSAGATTLGLLGDVRWDWVPVLLLG